MGLLTCGARRSRSGLLHGRIVLKTGRRVDNHRLARTYAAEHLACVAVRAAEGHGAALRLPVLEYEHYVLTAVLAQCGARHQHPAWPLLRVCRGFPVLQAGDAHARVR